MEALAKYTFKDSLSGIRFVFLCYTLYMREKSDNPFLASLRRYVENAAQVLDISKERIEQFLLPDRVIEKKLRIKLDNRKTFSVPAYRVQHNNILGPYKGGIRFRTDVDAHKLHALSVEMTLKNALMQLPLGGAKGGIAVDPTVLSERELERLSRAYVDSFFKYIGPNKDIPAPDMNTNAHVMAWMADEYNKKAGEIVWSAFTGKPPEIGGSGVREYATSLGGAIILEELLKFISYSVSSPTVAIQGFGNVGSNIAKILHKKGFIITAIANSRCTIFASKGINPEEVSRDEGKRRVSLQNCVGYDEKGEAADVLRADVDVLIPAALENQITAENAPHIKAEIVLEMANGAVTHEADEILQKQGIHVVPDILANAGGVVDSYFEWTQDRVGMFWKKDEEEKQLRDLMSGIFQNAINFSKENKVDLRKSVYALALKRFMRACTLLGKC